MRQEGINLKVSKKERRHLCARAIQSTLLLALLAVCGYTGASQDSMPTVSIPVVYETVSAWEASSEAVDDVRIRLEQERERESKMLDSVIDHPGSSREIVAQALAQKAQLAARIETEAQIRAALSYMGYAQVGVVCGADVITLFVPWQYAHNEAERMRLIGAAADQAGLSVENVKIILAKNE